MRRSLRRANCTRARARRIRPERHDAHKIGHLASCVVSSGVVPLAMLETLEPDSGSGNAWNVLNVRKRRPLEPVLLGRRACMDFPRVQEAAPPRGKASIDCAEGALRRV